MNTADRPLHHYAWLSVAAAGSTLALKLLAWKLTGSIALFSDALESLVNLAAALAALGAVLFAARPPDEDHRFGHDKIEYFASGFEGALILTAAVAIIWTALGRLSTPVPLHGLNLGLVLSGSASIINLIVGRLLVRKGRAAASPALEADGHHLLTDVWSSAAVLLGVGLVWLTGWQILDPLVALAAAGFILGMGVRLLRGAVRGLLDASLPEASLQVIRDVLQRHESQQVRFHALRTRASGARQFVSVHVLVPDEWTVRRGHDLLERIEADLRAVLPAGHIFTHLEPLNDPASWADQSLDR